MSILDGLVSEVLADVNVLGTFPSADDIVALFDTHGVVLVDRRIVFLRSESHAGQKVAEVDYFDCSSGRHIVLSLCCEESNRLLQLRPP
jgi:hypothetical protein